MDKHTYKAKQYIDDITNKDIEMVGLRPFMVIRTNINLLILKLY